MQLPRGILEKSHRGPGTLAAVTDGIAREGLTGYLRVSILSDNASECVVVYLAGKPVMSFVAGAKEDLPDPGMHAIAASIQQASCFIEICRLGEKQVSLLQEMYGNFACTEPLPPAKPAEKPAAVKQAQPQPSARAPAQHAPQEQAGAKPRALFVMPEIRGRFVRSEELEDIRDYASRYPDDTGHLLLIIRQNGAQEEHHAIIAGGRIEAVYNDRGIVPGIPGWLEGVPGVAEFYAVDPAALTSVLVRSLKGTPAPAISRPSPAAPAPAQPAATAVPAAKPPRPDQEPPQAKPPHAVQEKPAADRPARPKIIGVTAKSILEKSRAGEATHVEDEINRTVDEISQSMDDDIAMVRKVEQDFALHADELLEKLDLGHLRKSRRK